MSIFGNLFESKKERNEREWAETRRIEKMEKRGIKFHEQGWGDIYPYDYENNRYR